MKLVEVDRPIFALYEKTILKDHYIVLFAIMFVDLKSYSTLYSKEKFTNAKIKLLDKLTLILDSISLLTLAP